MENPIVVEHLSFSYPLYRHPRDVMVEMVTGRTRHEDFWALRDVSFTVDESDRLGVIGHNGSGKSTLLKILTGHLQPVAGRAEVRGQVSAMLGMNAVMNPEETGINNIRLNLLLNGHPRSSIPALTEEIIEFTELGPFIFSPVKTYSSGMNAKLAFAINTAVEPDILIIDEVLSVGDSYFVGKATKRMRELCDKGRALLFVSHSTAAVQMLCNKVLWLDNGQVKMFGPVDAVIAAYEEDYRRFEDEETRTGNASRAMTLRSGAPGDLSDTSFARMRLVPDNESGRFADTHYVRNIEIVDGDGGTTRVPLDLAEQTPGEVMGAHLDVLASEWGRLVTKDGADTRLLSSRTGRLAGGQILVPLSLVPTDGRLGSFSIEFSSLGGNEALAAQIFDYSAADWVNLEVQRRSTVDRSWNRIEFSLSSLDLDPRTIERALRNIRLASLPDVQIEDVSISTNGVRKNQVDHDEAFEIKVAAMPNRECGDVDIGIKLTRADGVYVFWQSSGMAGLPVNSPRGRFAVSFKFPPGLLGQGDYDISAYVSDGWDYPENYPYSMVYDRKVNAARITVRPRLRDVDLGVLAVMVDVALEEDAVG